MLNQVNQQKNQQNQKMKLNLNKILPIIACLIVLVGCVEDPSKYGKLNVRKSQEGANAFTFVVDEEYLIANRNSKKDPQNPQMTKAETALLKNLLRKENYCVDEGFKITSKQEKIYDITFAHLIEQNYKARPVAPRMYYGSCL